MSTQFRPFLLAALAAFSPALPADDLGGGRAAAHGRVPRFVLTSWIPGSQATFRFLDPSPSMTLAVGLVATRGSAINLPPIGTLTLDPLAPGLLSFSVPAAGTPLTLPAVLVGMELFYQGVWFDPQAQGPGFTDGTRADFFNPLCMVGNSRQSSNSISVIDLVAGRVVQTLTNSENGYVTFSPDRKWAFVCEPGLQRNRVVVYDLSRSPVTVSGTISVSGGIRYGCAMPRAGDRLYVPLHDGIAVIDMKPTSSTYRTEIQKIPTLFTGNSSTIFTGPLDLAITPDGRKLYVAYGENLTYPAQGNVGYFDLTRSPLREKLIPVTTGGTLSMPGLSLATRSRIVASADGLHVYTVEYGLNPASMGPFVLGFTQGALINVIFTPTTKEVAAVATGGYNQVDLCVDRLARNLWVAQVDGSNYGEALRLDVDRNSAGRFKTIRKIRLDPTPYSPAGAGPHGIDVTPDGSRVLVSLVEDSSHSTPQVVAVDTLTEKVVGQPIPVGSLCHTLSIQQR